VRRNLLGVLLLVMAVFAAGCQKSANVGQGLKNFKDKRNAAAIRDVLNSPPPSTAATSNPNVIGNSPKPTAAASQAPQQSVFEIKLTHETPYYAPAQDLQVTAGTLIKIVNSDDKLRRFGTQDGPYDTGDIAPGATKEFTANIKGKWDLQDPNVPFATGTLTVS
jgi:hypothetical protein